MGRDVVIGFESVYRQCVLRSSSKKATAESFLSVSFDKC